MVYTNLTDLIGHTPLLKLHAVEGQKADILVKLESFNPGGSVKDRVAQRQHWRGPGLGEHCQGV